MIVKFKREPLLLDFSGIYLLLYLKKYKNAILAIQAEGFIYQELLSSRIRNSPERRKKPH